MTDTTKAVQRIASLAFTAAEAKLREIDLQETELKETIIDLRQRRTEKSIVGDAFFGEADLLWRQWINVRLEELNLSLAQLRAKKERAKAMLRKAYKKQEGLSLLAEADAKQSKTREDRRRSYES